MKKVKKYVPRCNCSKVSTSVIYYGTTQLNDDKETCYFCGNFVYWDKEWKNNFTDDHKKEILELYKNGLSQRKIAKLLKVSYYSINKLLKESLAA